MNHDVICVAPNPWADLWRRRQQLMSRFARRGVKVLYIEPPRSVLSPRRELRSRHRELASRFGLRRESEQLYVYAPLSPLPLARIPLIDAIDEAWVLAGIRRVVKGLDMTHPILWLYYASKTALIARTIEQVSPPGLICYDCHDYYAGYAGVDGLRKPSVLAQERKLVEMADIVFVVSEALYAHKRALNPRTFLVRNGVDAALYDTSNPMPDDMARLPRPIVGFTGKISASKIDARLIRHLAESRPDWSVVLVGPIFPDLQRVLGGWPKYGNLHLLGEKHRTELPAYVQSFDVCIAPYLFNEQLVYVDAPLKVYEYLAAGKPIVATGFSPAEFLRDWLETATSPMGFVAAIEKALKETAVHSQTCVQRIADQRRRVAMSNTWDHRVAQISMLIDKRLAERSGH